MPKQRKTEKTSSSGQSSPGLKTGQLLFVATPIGNLGDITLRALESLRQADVIACEDTRHAGKLLQHYDIKKPLLAYHDHNESTASDGLIARVQRGETVAIISDAGMPLIADPGFRLMQKALAAGIAVSALPGANAALLGLVLSGLPTDRFYFGGFLPEKSNARQMALAAVATLPVSLLFYESPARCVSSLTDMISIFGPARPAAVARELTKHFEDIRRGTLQSLADFYTATPPKGEIVIIVHGVSAPAHTALDHEKLLRAALEKHGVKQAAQIVAAQTGEKISVLYTLALQLKKKS